MKRILFEYTGNAYLPEIGAYRRFLEGHQEFEAYDNQKDPEIRSEDCDIVWRFMGIDRTPKKTILVHEYNSLSTGRLPRLKNLVKKTLNHQPDMRIFLNDAVVDGFGFKDGIPYVLRDMGVDQTFFSAQAKKEFDLVYMGSISADRGMFQALEKFCHELKDLRLLIIGEIAPEIRSSFTRHGNIEFTGRVPHQEVAEHAARAMAGLNLMPDCYPLSRQTSTKLLEYCALGLNVVSTSYDWVSRFAEERSARFLWVREDLSDLTAKRLSDFNYSIPDVGDLEWNDVIRKSGAFERLKEL